MSRLILGCTLLVLALAAVPAVAQNCVSYTCYWDGTCAYCGSYIYNGASSCSVNIWGTDCNLSGYCDTGMGDECPRPVSCMPNLVRVLRPRPFREEWSLVRATVRAQDGKRRQS